MIHLYGAGFTQEDKTNYKNVISQNVIYAIQTLILNSPSYGVIDEKLSDAKTAISELKGDNIVIDHTLAKSIGSLWQDGAIQKTYSARAKFQFLDSAKYFLDKVAEIGEEKYVPSQQDMLHARAPTRAIVEHNVVIKERTFKLVDVGGQRAMRKRWLHCFERVTCVIFVAAISEFDQKLEEDEETNRLTEALELFGDICNSRWFKKTAMILFLNKRDILEEKLKLLKLKDYCSDYTGDNSFPSACKYFEQAFLSKNRREDRVIYTHLTCATDTNNVEITFNAVRDIIVRKAITDIGLRV
jgi:hypothetical protein